MAKDQIDEMDNENTPAEIVEEKAPSANSSPLGGVMFDDDDDDQPEEGGTMVDTGYLAAYWAAHPEEAPGAQSAQSQPEPQPVVEKPAPAPSSGGIMFGGGSIDDDDDFEDSGEGKTSIASLADIEAMMKAELGQPKEAKTSSEVSADEVKQALESCTLNSPVEAAIKPVLDDSDLPKAKQTRSMSQLIDKPITMTGAHAGATATVEEMDNYWTEDKSSNFDEQDIVEWSARSAEHQAPMIPENTPADGQSQESSAPEDNFIESEVQSKEEARLICLTGEMNGQEYVVAEHDITIGRQEGNTIAIPDTSLSRKHATIVKNEDVYVVIDNHSSNGTFVNGQRVDRARLHSGDEIVFGNIGFRFVEIGDIASAASAQPGFPMANGQVPAGNSQTGNKPPKRFIVAAMSIAMVLAFFMGLVLNKIRAPKTEHIDAAQIRAIYDEGIAFYKNRKWAESQQKFVSLSQLEPNSRLVNKYIERIKLESEVSHRLFTIQKSIEKGLLKEASVSLGKIPSETVYVAEVSSMGNQIATSAQKQLDSVREIIDGEDAAEALPMIEALSGKLPESYRGRLEGLTKEVQDKLNKDKDRGHGRARVAAKATQNKPAVVQDSTENSALSLFKERKLDASLKLLESKGAPNSSAPSELVALHNKITKFNQSYQEARQQWQLKNAEEAISSIKRAISLESKITSGQSPYASELKSWLSDMLYLKGLKYYTGGKLDLAFKQFNEAIINNPGHNQSRAKLDELSAKAEDKYRRAYILKNSDPTQCRALLNEAIRMVAEYDPVYQKCRSLLNDLQ